MKQKGTAILDSEGLGMDEKPPAKSFVDLEVWQMAHRIVLQVYAVTRHFPDDERFGLTSQFRRAAFAVPSNIAEGFKRFGKPDKAQFYNMAEGSLEECRYWCMLSRDLGYGDTDGILAALDAMAPRLAAYIKKIRGSNGA